MCPCRVLVVDDNADVRESLVILLELLGHQAVSMGSGALALEALRAAHRSSTPFTLAIVDVGMPEMSGYELVAAMRKEATGGAMMIAALTGRVTAADRARSGEAGFDAHLAKPVDMKVLEALLHRVESGSVQRDAL